MPLTVPPTFGSLGGDPSDNAALAAALAAAGGLPTDSSAYGVLTNATLGSNDLLVVFDVSAAAGSQHSVIAANKFVTWLGLGGMAYEETAAWATQAYVDAAIANLVNSSPAALDTLNELAAALGNDANFATTVTNSLATKAGLADNNAFTGANTFTNAAGIVTRQAATQDGITLLGRAGGTSSYSASITTAALTASRTFTIPAVTGNDTFALLGIAQTFTAAQTFTPSGGTSANAATFNGRVVINGNATQDLRLGSAGMFLTNVSNNRICILDSSSGGAYTFWNDSSLWLNKTTGNIGWRNGATTVFSDASNQLDMRNSTSAQTINVYRTYTDGSNYERMALKSASGYFEVACETAGSGTDDLDLRLTPAGTGLVNLPGGTLLKTRTALTDGAGVNTGTLLNAPASGNPTKWVPINDNGTTRYIPMW